jgi:hypothetical protein
MLRLNCSRSLERLVVLDIKLYVELPIFVLSMICDVRMFK